MTAKPIPGPYRIAEMAMNDGAVPILAGEDENTVHVAHVVHHTKAKRGETWRTPCPTRDATARLLAAAPLMRDALAALVASVIVRTNQGNVYALGKLYEAEALARDALAAVEPKGWEPLPIHTMGELRDRMAALPSEDDRAQAAQFIRSGSLTKAADWVLKCERRLHDQTNNPETDDDAG